MHLNIQFTGMSLPLSLPVTLSYCIRCWRNLLSFPADFQEALSLDHQLLDRRLSHWTICCSMSSYCRHVLPPLLSYWNDCWLVFVEPMLLSTSFTEMLLPPCLQLTALLHAVLKESPEFFGNFPNSIVIGPSTTGEKPKTLNYLSEFCSVL